MSIRGKKREEYVREWLEGKENPDVEVIPTKKEGKYIVRERVKVEPVKVGEENAEMKDEKSELNNTEKNTAPEPENNIVPEPEIIKNNNSGIGLEILEQLKLLNEYKQKKLEKKAKKKEIKKVIRKEFVKNKVLVENSDESDDETVYVPPPGGFTASASFARPEPQKIYIQKPPLIRTRRRINLLQRNGLN